MLAMQALSIFTTLMSAVINEKFSFGIRKQIYEKIINSHWMDVKKYHTGGLMTRLTSDAGNIAAITCWWFGKKLRKLQQKVQESESSYRSFLQESMANLLIVKSFANEEYSTNKLTELRENRFFWVFKKTKMSVTSSFVMNMAFQIGYIAAFAFGAYQIANRSITYGVMSVLLSLVNRVQSPIIMLAQQVPSVVMVFRRGRHSVLPLTERLSEKRHF